MKLRTAAARLALVAALVVAASFVADHAPHEQTLAIRLGDADVVRVEAVLLEDGVTEPLGGFSQSFTSGAPRVVRHSLSVPNGDYKVVVTLTRRAEPLPDSNSVTGDAGPIPSETSFERRVNLTGGEVVISPD